MLSRLRVDNIIEVSGFEVNGLACHTLFTPHFPLSIIFLVVSICGLLVILHEIRANEPFVKITSYIRDTVAWNLP